MRPGKAVRSAWDRAWVVSAVVTGRQTRSVLRRKSVPADAAVLVAVLEPGRSVLNTLAFGSRLVPKAALFAELEGCRSSPAKETLAVSG